MYPKLHDSAIRIRWAEDFRNKLFSLSSLLQIQIVFTQRFVELFDRITQQHARHCGGMFVEEYVQAISVHITRGPQHPASAFVDQVLLIIYQQGGDLERIVD